MTDQELCTNYKSMIFKMAHALSPEYFEDLVSVGYSSLLQAYKKFDPLRKVKFSTYARREIEYDMKDELRKLSWFSYDRNKKNYQLVRLSDCVAYEAEDSNVEESLIQKEGVEFLQECLDDLIPIEKDVITLYFWNEMNLMEIASSLHISESGVKVIKDRALKKIKEKSNGRQNTENSN